VDTKPRAHRTVRLLEPLQEDLKAWRQHNGGRAVDSALVFPTAAGDLWTKVDWDNWRCRQFRRAASTIGLDSARPYDLRHSFASLLLHEGRSAMDIARQLGHDARLTLSTYGHVIDELDDSPQIPAEDAIRAAARARVSPVGHERKAMRNAYVPVRREGPLVAGRSADGARGTRTPDLLGAIQALSQLSYSPEEGTV
jgi:hypothetical protein